MIRLSLRCIYADRDFWRKALQHYVEARTEIAISDNAYGAYDHEPYFLARQRSTETRRGVARNIEE